MNSIVVGMGDIYYSLTLLSVECVLCCFKTSEQSTDFLFARGLSLLHFCECCFNRLAVGYLLRVH